MRRNLALAFVLAALLAVGVVSVAGGDDGPKAGPGTQAVLFVGNNWDGTADIVDPVTFKSLERFNVVPDLQERLDEIATDPVRLGYFIAIRNLIGEGNDQYVDDMFSSHDGRFVYVSRPSLRDVVSIDLATKKIVWRFVVDGQRSDHMAISPDGKVVLVSASTGNVVHAIDTATGKEVGRWATGDSPHENNYSADGTKIFHASIGLVYTPADQPIADSSKGDRFFQIVDAKTYKVLKSYDIGKIMAEQGLGQYSSAVRPMAISPDEKKIYMQLSFLHGFVEFDLATEKVQRVANLPIEGEGTSPKENYLLDSAHHGLSINADGSKLCAAGTMSDYAAIVNTSDFSFTQIRDIKKPYWSTNSGDGKHCFVSASGADKVVVIDYASAKKVAEIPVGDHPQRMRMGVIRSEFLKTGAKPAAGPPRGVPNLQVLRARTRGGRLELKLRISSRAKGVLRATYTAGGQRSAFAIKVPRRSSGTALWTVRRALTGRQRGAATGVLDLRFAGNTQVLADRTVIRTAATGADLRTTSASIETDQARLRAAGTISKRARGTMRARFAYIGEGTRVRYLRWSVPIRNGRFTLSKVVPSLAARAGGHLTLEYAGDAARRLGGERIAERVRP
jgi:YVTN family beta-propeller protein